MAVVISDHLLGRGERLLDTERDERLVALAQAGHETAFATIFRRYECELLAQARRLSSDGRAEDAVQQAFLNAFAALQAGRDVRHLRGWLHQILRNVITRARVPVDAPLEDALVHGEPMEETVARRAQAYTTLVELSALPDRQRDALVRTALLGVPRARSGARGATRARRCTPAPSPRVARPCRNRQIRAPGPGPGPGPAALKQIPAGRVTFRARPTLPPRNPHPSPPVWGGERRNTSMRRILYTVAASAALGVAAPSMALARNGDHHKRHHHAHVRHETFKAHRHDTSGSSGSSSATSSEPTAGTVATFANNILRITLTNGSTVSGAVTNETEVTCENPEMQNADTDADDNGAGDEQGDAVFHHSDGGGENGDDRGDDNSNDQTCTIMPGMAVRQAELTINGTGAIWNEIELVSSTTSTSSQS